MVCVYCDSPTQVVNSRQQRRTNNIWRRRQCSECGAIFTTLEKPDLLTSFMVRDKTATKMTPFSRDRLFLSVYESCRHREDSVNDATELTRTIIAGLTFPKEQPLPIDHIVQVTLETLGRFDIVAATFYKAYHEK